MAQARNETFDAEQAVRDLQMDERTVREICHDAESAGLIFASADRSGELAILRHAGRQYLALQGQVNEDSLFFLAEVIDDLFAREALMRAGFSLVDQFREALLEGWAVEHAEELVPVAFRAAVDDRLAVDLFAASVALVARLSSGDAAGCLAEEIVSITLLAEAKALLNERHEEHDLDAKELRAAKGALVGLFDLFGDDDVLRMFEMEEPADAALAGHSPVNRRLGSADQRLEAWFAPLNPAAPTGHLSESS